MAQNPDAGKTIEAYARFGQPAPAGLKPPELAPFAVPYWKAYLELCTERQIGMAAGPIPWGSIARYADRHGFDEQFLVDVVRTVEHAEQEAKPKHPKQQGETDGSSSAGDKG